MQIIECIERFVISLQCEHKISEQKIFLAFIIRNVKLKSFSNTEIEHGIFLGSKIPNSLVFYCIGY